GVYALQPVSVFEKPVYRMGKAFFEGNGGLVAELGVNLRGIDSVSYVGPRAAFDVVDQLVGGPSRRADFLVYWPAELVNEVNILPFVKTADVVGLPVLAFVINEVDAACMVDDVQPIARVFPVTIDGKGFFVQDVQDTEGNQFLGKVIGPIVVGTVGNHHR